MAPRVTPLATLAIEPVSLNSFRRTFTSTRSRHVGEQTGSKFPLETPSRSLDSHPVSIGYRPREGLGLSRPSTQSDRRQTADKLVTTYRGKARQTSADEYQDYVRRGSLQKLLTRRWKAGDVYAPHDLSSAEMQKWRMAKKPTTDAFDLLALNPLEQYKVRTSVEAYGRC